jgi:hypothetical protein
MLWVLVTFGVVIGGYADKPTCMGAGAGIGASNGVTPTYYCIQAPKGSSDKILTGQGLNAVTNN